MEPHRHGDDLLKRALARSAHLLQHDADLQRLAPSPEARERLASAGSSIRCLATACELYAGRPCFGERAFVAEQGAIRHLPELRVTTYAELWSRIEAFASGLHHARLSGAGTAVGICGKSSIDWVVADLACLYLAAVSVPLPAAGAPGDLRRIVTEAEVSCLVCGVEQVERLAAILPDAPAVRGLVVMGVNEQDRARVEALERALRELRQKHGLTVWIQAELERLGREGGIVPPVEPGADDPLRTLVYTSGSTGSPKGAMFRESLWAQQWRAPWPASFPSVPYVSVDYMPLNHMAGRGAILRSLMEGGLTSFVLAADMSTLFEDICIARPTFLFLVPRVAGMIYQHFQTEVMKRVAEHEGARLWVETQVLEEMRGSYLGNRLLYAITGAAPTAPEVVAFLERCFEIPVLDGYGSTEAGLIAFENRIARETVTDFKLVDVPELGYLGTDEPYPRGELCLTSPRVISGYYKNPEATRELFDDQGYLRTGDIVEQRGPDEVVWIDRKKNVLKLSQGEFVSTSRLEELYGAGSPFIHQVFIHGSSLRSYLLAVVVPRGIDAGRADAAEIVRAEIDRIAAREGLPGYEIPRAFLIETEPFSRENGLLTESNKPSRPRLRAHYGERLESLYAAIEQSQLDELHALERDRCERRSVAEKVSMALAATLGLPAVDVQKTTASFLQLGGDSLGAARFAALVEDGCGVAVPAGLVLDPTSRVGAIVRWVEDRIAGEAPGRGGTFEEVHGAGAESVRAEDLRADRFLAPDELDPGTRAPMRPRAQVVLLTGANGFLGRFLLLELLERLPRQGGKVVCVVRAPGDDAALERLGASYVGPDPTLRARFAALSANGRLSVLAGDLLRPRFGLPDNRYDELGDEVDAIVHSGALVNHALSYVQLFEPNVLGTVEVIRLALRRRLKSVGFVSTVGVAEGLDRPGPVLESEDGRALWQSRPIDSGHAVGYSTSKWAGEILVGDVAERCGVPVDVFRCSMILPPRAFIGQVNAGDFLTRLLHGVVVVGIAPRSFYAGIAGKPHFDGLPVDVAARMIAEIAVDRRPGLATYHVVDGHWDDGVSLDTFVDWTRSAGYAVERVDDHAKWYQAFRERLEALGPAQKARSPLPILQQWAEPIRAVTAFDDRRLRERLAALEGAAEPIPSIDELFVHQYLKNMVYQGLIDRPGVSVAA